MPTYRHGDMWSAWKAAELFLITTNSTVKSNGALVMGRGIAKQARDRFPGLDLALGQAISAYTNPTVYYLMVSPRWPKAKLGAFQVKTGFRGQADLALIRDSVRALIEWLDDHHSLPEHHHRTRPIAVHLNFPGIGNGRLPYEKVKPLVDQLPDNVNIWTRN